jgi:hypothetical protein
MRFPWSISFNRILHVLMKEIESHNNFSLLSWNSLLWKFFWKNMTNCFGDGQCSKGEDCIWRTAKKDR